MIISITPISNAEPAIIDPIISQYILGVVRAGPQGTQGYAGWSPALAVVEDGERSVLKVVAWFGGEGDAPTDVGFVGPDGFVTYIHDATDFRGAEGAGGVNVTNAVVDSAFHLQMFLSDGSDIDAGYVRGPAGAVAVGTVTTVSPSSPATVTNVGTPDNAVLNFEIPQGISGTGAGTVTSVGVSVPTGLAVSPSGISSSGTFAITWSAGYQGYTSAEAAKLAGIATGAQVNTVNSVAGLTGTIGAAALKTALAVTMADITDATANGRSLVKAANFAAMLALLNGQPLDSDLTAIAALTPTAGSVIYGNGSAWTALPLNQMLVVREEQTGSSGGGASANSAWQTRNLNTILDNTIPTATVSANVISLPAGKYYAQAACPGYQVSGSKARLWNITTGAEVIRGQSTTSNTTVQTFATIDGTFTLTAPANIRLEHYTTTVLATNGLGVGVIGGSGTVDVYSTLTIVKVN